MLSGAPHTLSEYQVVQGYRVVTNARGGFFDPVVKPGDRVSAGSELGRIINVYGDVVETMRAPSDAIVIGVSSYPAWATGGWLIELGTGVVTRARP